MVPLIRRQDAICVETNQARMSSRDYLPSIDIKKLRRLLKYLCSTADRGIALEMGDDVIVWVYIDAAYGVHMDCGISQSGMAVLIGLGTVMVSCRKQHINTKSSTEADTPQELLTRTGVRLS